nr:MAG TPA: hypothetical protein [Caudoviricetes sp.]
MVRQASPTRGIKESLTEVQFSSVSCLSWILVFNSLAIFKMPPYFSLLLSHSLILK